MKRVFKIVMGLACVVVAACAFAACDACADGHTWEENVIKAATCTEKGYVERTCLVCGFNEAVETPTIPHQFVETSTVQPTCTTYGEILSVCTACGGVNCQTIEELGHLSRTIPGFAPTCTQEGYSDEVVCDRCNIVLQPKHVIAERAHSYIDGVCKDCGAEQTFTATFVAIRQTIKQINFTVSTREKVTEEAPEIPVTPKGYKNLRWEAYEVVLRDFTVHALYDVISYPITYHDPKNAPNSNPAEYTVEQTVELAAPHLDGYTFEGWFSGDDRVTELPAGTTGEQSFEARWTLTQYTITYEGIDNPAQYGLPTTYTIESNSIVLPTIQEEGRTFRGWEKDGITIGSIPGGSFGDLTIRACFDPLIYRVTLDASGGVVNKTYQNVYYGEYYNLPVPVRSGFDFLGWYTNSGETGMPYTDNTGASLGKYKQFHDKVLYAHWTSRTFTVIYDSCGGDPVTAKSYLYGEMFLPVETSNANGYLFDGWYNEDGTVKYTDATPVTENMTVYARWIDSIPISTAEELIAIANDPTANYHLTRDINMNGTVWTPIEEFSGILNGNGHSIMNVILNCVTSVENVGFINLNKGRIENLAFVDVIYSVVIDQPTMGMNGGIIAATNEGEIRGCKVSKGSYQLSFTKSNQWSCTFELKFGEIAGNQLKGGIIDNCSAAIDATVTLNAQGTGTDSLERVLILYFGGLVGFNAGSVTQGNYVGSVKSNNSAYGKVSGMIGHIKIRGKSIPNIGGIAGCNSDEGNIQKCFSDLNLNIASKAEGEEGYVNAYVGGVCGLNTGKGSTIAWCYSKGTMEGSGVNVTNFGGFVGLNTLDAVVSSCYSTLDVKGNYKGEYGGFVGKNEAIVKNCYATGNVSCDSTESDAYIGGFVGHAAASSNISMSYSMGAVSASGGNVDYFVGLNEIGGTLYKVFYPSGVTVKVNGQVLNRVTEYGTSKDLGQLWSEEFLVSELYWDEEGWIILLDENPMLDWEVMVESYDTYIVEPTCEDFGYTVYVSPDKGRIFMRSYTQPLGHSFDYNHPITKKRTCTEDGHVYYKCLNEGEDSPLYDSGEIDRATGHVQGEYLRGEKATCTEDGYADYRCTVCEKEFTVIETAKGHTLPEGGDDGNMVNGS